MKVTVYVEGGRGKNQAIVTECRKGFSEFFRKAGLEDRRPKVVPCGTRRHAFERFAQSLESYAATEFPVLLVDSEDPITGQSTWDHVKSRIWDGWERPNGALDEHLQFMVLTMEAWFHADREVLKTFYGNKFHEAALSPRKDIENIPKDQLNSGLSNSTKDCPKGQYSKGQHSFKILAIIDPQKVADSSDYARRLIDLLRQKCT